MMSRLRVAAVEIESSLQLFSFTNAVVVSVAQDSFFQPLKTRFSAIADDREVGGVGCWRKQFPAAATTALRGGRGTFSSRHSLRLLQHLQWPQVQPQLEVHMEM